MAYRTVNIFQTFSSGGISFDVFVNFFLRSLEHCAVVLTFNEELIRKKNYITFEFKFQFVCSNLERELLTLLEINISSASHKF